MKHDSRRFWFTTLFCCSLSVLAVVLGKAQSQKKQPGGTTITESPISSRSGSPQQSSASADIKLNEEAQKQIETKMNSMFRKYPNPNKELSGTTVIYVLTWAGDHYELIEFTDFRWESEGQPSSSSKKDQLNGVDLEWGGSVRTRAKYYRKWNEELKAWGKYDDAYQTCYLQVLKQKGKEWEFAPPFCQYGGSGTVLTRGQAEALEKGEVDFDEFVDRDRIANGDIALGDARRIAEALVPRIFRRGRNGKWYASTVNPGKFFQPTPNPRETWIVHQFEDLRCRVKGRGNDYELKFSASTYRIYYYNDPERGGWSEKTQDEVLGKLHLYKKDGIWFVENGNEMTASGSRYSSSKPAQKWDEIRWELEEAGALIAFDKFPIHGNAAPRWPLIPTDPAIIEKIVDQSVVR